MSISEELNVSEDELEEMDLQWEEETGNSGEGRYGYYAYITESAPEAVLARNGWKVGDVVRVGPSAFEGPED